MAVEELRAKIREIPDFPKPGILFYDITTLLKDREAFTDVIDRMGFPRELAHDLVVETLIGSAEYAAQSELHPAQLRNAVTSPGGTSAAAIYELEKGRLRTVLSDAVWAAYRRTQELGEALERESGA